MIKATKAAAMTREEYLDAFAEAGGFARVNCLMGLDMAEQALDKALEAASRAIDLHHDEQVQSIATAMLLDLLTMHVQDKSPQAALLLVLEKVAQREAS